MVVEEESIDESCVLLCDVRLAADFLTIFVVFKNGPEQIVNAAKKQIKIRTPLAQHIMTFQLLYPALLRVFCMIKLLPLTNQNLT